MKHETYIAIITWTYSVISLFGQERDARKDKHTEKVLSTKDREVQDVTELSITMDVADRGMILGLLKACLHKCPFTLPILIAFMTP